GAGYCWGDNNQGQLGNGTTTTEKSPTAVSGSLTFSSISTSADNAFGVASACGVTTPSDTAYCWGYNGYGELGNNSTTSSKTPVAVNGSYAFSQISIGPGFVCGVTKGGAGYCWGDGLDGELGQGADTSSKVPVAVSGGYTFSSISVSGNSSFSYSCGVTTTGVGYCWGDNFFGQLGDGSATATDAPVAVSGSYTFLQVS